MAAGTLTCTVEDYKGKNATCRVSSTDATIAKALIMAEYIKTHSDAKVKSYGLTLDYAGDSVDSGKYDRVLQGLRYIYEKADGKTLLFTLPAPRDEDVDVDQEPDSDTAEDLRDMLVSVSACTSAAVFQGGGLNSRLPKKESRKKATTGV